MKNTTSVESTISFANPTTSKVLATLKKLTGVSRLPAILLFILAAFFASGVRAQSKVIVDPSRTGNQNEPSIIVRPWDTSGNPDGKTIIASWQEFAGGSDGDWDDEETHTSISTDAGQTWAVQTKISIPAECQGVGDARLAYRQTGTPAKPQLLCAFTSFHDDAAIGGLYIGFSSDDGNSWGTESAIDTVSYGAMATRPSIVTDNNSGSSYKGNTYVCWTDVCGIVNNTEVRVATIGAGSTTASSYTTIAEYNPNIYCSACSISVASDGTVVLLWQKCHAIDSTRDFYIATSTDGGATWPDSLRYTLYTGLSSPDTAGTYEDFFGNPHSRDELYCLPYFRDYPTLTISKGCSTERVFVAYTVATTNPSDLFLTSAAYSTSLKKIGTWDTATTIAQIRPYSGTNNSSAFDFQFQPALCPDGVGGIFLLYYSQQVGGSSPGPNEIPVIYESGGTEDIAPHRAISDPISAFTRTLSKNGNGVGDYIGIAWDAIYSIAHPIWTDFNTSDNTYDIYTVMITPPGQYQGTTKYCNQNKVVGDGNYKFMVSLHGNTIQYERTLTSNTNVLIETKSWSDSNYLYDDPSIALYSLPLGFDPNHLSLCVTWEGYDEDSVIMKSSVKRVFWVTANSTDAGVTWSWSGVSHYDLTRSLLMLDPILSDDSTSALLTASEASRITPVTAPIINDDSGRTRSCGGFAIYWGNGVSGIRCLDVDTAGALEYPIAGDAFLVSGAPDGSNRFWHPSCVSAWFGTSDLGNVYPSELGNRKIWIVWDAGCPTPPVNIWGTEDTIGLAGNGWKPANLGGVNGYTGYCSGVPYTCSSVVSGTQASWLLSNEPLTYPYVVDDHYPHITLDDKGFQRVSWLSSPFNVNVNPTSYYSSVVALQIVPWAQSSDGCPGGSSDACAGDGCQHPTSCQLNFDSRNASYANQVFWQWSTPSGASDSNLVTSASITGHPIDCSKSAVSGVGDSVELVWVTDESVVSGASDVLRFTDDIDEDGNFGHSTNEIVPSAFGTLSGYPNGTDVNTEAGNANQKWNSMYVYTGQDCNGNSIVESNQQGFAPALKAARNLTQEEVTYYAPGKFSVSLDNLAVNGSTAAASDFLHYSCAQMPVTKPFQVHGGDSVSFDWRTTQTDSLDYIGLSIVSSNDTVFLAKASAMTSEGEHVVWTAPRSGDYFLVLSTPPQLKSPSTGYMNKNGITAKSTIALNALPPAMGPLDELFVQPNPFSDRTTIYYRTPGGLDIQLGLYDLTGKEVRELDAGIRDAGVHEITFSGQGLVGGTYFVRLEAGNAIQVRKLIFER